MNHNSNPSIAPLTTIAPSPHAHFPCLSVSTRSQIPLTPSKWRHCLFTRAFGHSRQINTSFFHCFLPIMPVCKVSRVLHINNITHNISRVTKSSRVHLLVRYYGRDPESVSRETGVHSAPEQSGTVWEFPFPSRLLSNCIAWRTQRLSSTTTRNINSSFWETRWLSTFLVTSASYAPRSSRHRSAFC